MNLFPEILSKSPKYILSLDIKSFFCYNKNIKGKTKLQVFKIKNSFSSERGVF